MKHGGPYPRHGLWLNSAALICFVLLTGAALAHFSFTTHPRFLTRLEALDSQKAILERRPFVFGGEEVDYAWRNRVVVPYAIEAISRVSGSTFSQSYLVVRLLTACASIVAFGFLVRRGLGASIWLCAAAAAVFSVTLLPTFLHIYEIPSDFLDAAAFSLLVLFAVQKRRAAFTVVMLTALLNRESAIFGSLVWLSLHGWPVQRGAFWREFVYCGILVSAGAAVLFITRAMNSVPTSSGIASVLQPDTPITLGITHFHMVRSFFADPNFSNPLFFLFGYLSLLALIAITHWSRFAPAWRRLGVCGVLIFLVSLGYGNIKELRVFIPSLVISAFLVTALALKESSPEGRPAEAGAAHPGGKGSGP